VRRGPRCPASKQTRRLSFRQCGATLLVLVLAAACGNRQDVVGRQEPLDQQARRVADSFVEDLLSGRWAEASRVVDNPSRAYSAHLRRLSMDFLKEDTRVSGPKKTSGNSITYPLTGTRNVPAALGGGLKQVISSIQVWLVPVAAEWQVDRYWWQVKETRNAPSGQMKDNS
jgi:hypothetical protein